MIFRQHQQVLDGTKTQTRRPVYPGQRLVCNRGFGLPDMVVTTGNLVGYCGEVRKWVVGRTYAVQPPGKKSVGRIRITKIRRERLQDISLHFDDILAEGVKKDILDVGYTWRMRWVRLWNSIYKEPYRWDDNPEVWVLEFEGASSG